MPKTTSSAERGLRYIAASPAREHGGFHPEAVRTAKSALRLIARLRKAASR
jgi:hypothetical protein